MSPQARSMDSTGDWFQIEVNGLLVKSREDRKTDEKIEFAN